MPTRRQKRINELLREELSMLIAGRTDDPRLANVAVTRVETTRDLSTAKVYVTGSGDDEEAAAMLEGLDHARHFLRTELQTLGLRRLPELVFARDRQFESGERILAILDQLRESAGPVDARTHNDLASASGNLDPAADRDDPDAIGP